MNSMKVNLDAIIEQKIKKQFSFKKALKDQECNEGEGWFTGYNEGYLAGLEFCLSNMEQ